MRILAYRAKDYKGLRDVSIEAPDATLVLIAGANGSGKTSLLDSIQSALCGKGASPAEPVRRGADRAEVRIDLGEYRVTRRWFGDGRSKLYVDRADGTGVAAPQAALDAVVGRVAFDPLAFVNARPDEQARTLRKLAGLEGELARIDDAAKAAYDERTDVNRAVRQDEAALAGYPEAEFAGLPDDVPDPGALMEEYRDAVDERACNDAMRDDVKEADREMRNCHRDTEEARREVDRARLALAKAQDGVAMRERLEAEAMDAYNDALDSARDLRDPDVDAIKARVVAASADADRARRRAERRAVLERLEGLHAESEKLTGLIGSLAAEREARLAAAPLPVEGLSLRGDVASYNGVPLAQASAAERLKVGLAVGLALDPALRVALVRDGSLLDDASMALVEEWASTRDVQVWVERVGAGGPKSIVIEEGRVAAAGSRDKAPAAVPPEADDIPW